MNEVELPEAELFKVEFSERLSDISACSALLTSGSFFSCSLALFQESSLVKASSILSSTFLVSVPGVKKTDPTGPRMLVESDLLEAAAACRRDAAATIINKIAIALFMIPTFCATLISEVSNTILTFLFCLSFSPCG